MAEFSMHLREVARRGASSLRTPVYRSSLALILTTVVNAVLGVLFWVAAARLYSTRVVGLGAGGISALQLTATIGWVGLIFTLMRYVPVAGSHRRRLMLGVYGSGVTLATLVALLFTTTLADSFKVPYVSDNIGAAGAFCIGVAVWVVFTLQDSALISLRRSSIVTIENLLYGLLKLVLLIVLSASDKPWTLLGVWTGSALVFVGIVSGFILVLDPLLRTQTAPQAKLSKRALANFSIGHTAAAIIAVIPDYLVPLLVLSYLDAAANAYYYAAWSISLSARALSVNVTDALMVEAAYGEESFLELLQKLARLFTAILVPTIVCMLLGAGIILRIFGSRYSDGGATVLRLFAIALVPFTLVTLALALDRVRERFKDALLITTAGTSTTIGLDLILIPSLGIKGAGVSWLCGETVAAMFAVRSLWKGLGLRAPV